MSHPNQDDRREAARRAEMERNYPAFRAFVYAKVREEFERTLPELPPDVDLEALIKEEGGQPLEAFIDAIRRGPGGAAR